MDDDEYEPYPINKEAELAELRRQNLPAQNGEQYIVDRELLKVRWAQCALGWSVSLSRPGDLTRAPHREQHLIAEFDRPPSFISRTVMHRRVDQGCSLLSA